MKGNWNGFASEDNTPVVINEDSGAVSKDSLGPVNGQDYNSAGSSNVGRVDTVTTLSNVHSIPTTGTPNSVTKNYKDGKLNMERYYDNNGEPYLDIDYSNHGNAKMHPYVPHEHKIAFKDGKIDREISDGRIEQ